MAGMTFWEHKALNNPSDCLTTCDFTLMRVADFVNIQAVIFFVALVQLCFYIGIFQWFIGKFAVFFFWSMVRTYRRRSFLFSTAVESQAMFRGQC